MRSTILNKGNWLLLICLFTFFTACKKNNADLALNGNADITGFTANGASATISESAKTIKITLPFGSDVTKVKPTFTVPAGSVVTPASGEAVDMSLPVTYKVVNGNIYSTYNVSAKVQPAFVSFKIDTVSGVVNDLSRTINLTMPPGSSVNNVIPKIVLSTGLTISPAADKAQDFTKPVNYTVTSSVTSVTYTVNVTVLANIPYIAYVGFASSRSGITNPDEKAAADWLFGNYPHAEYVVFDDINTGKVNLSKYKVIWWHYDSSQQLPDVSNYGNILNALKAYYAGGGNFLFSGYADQYLVPLGIVPNGKGPNNVFGDSNPGIDPNNDWGTSFPGQAANPLFQGLTVSATNPTTAYLLGKGVQRENHTAQWKVNEWGGYGNTAGWQAATGGIALASTDGSNTDNTVNIAQWPSVNKSGRTIIFALGAYDWYNEPDANTGAPSIANPYKPNIIKLTQNALSILTQ
jgi:hypothetical protein